MLATSARFLGVSKIHGPNPSHNTRSTSEVGGPEITGLGFVVTGSVMFSERM